MHATLAPLRDIPIHCDISPGPSAQIALILVALLTYTDSEQDWIRGLPKKKHRGVGTLLRLQIDMHLQNSKAF